MSQIGNGIPATLRRRARVLERDGYDPDWIAVLLRAAEELHIRQRAAGDCKGCDENIAVAAMADNRRLRAALVKLAGVVKIADIPITERRRVLDELRNTLMATRAPGDGRTILALEVYPGTTREALEETMASLLDRHFQGGTNGEEGSSEEGDDEAEPAGRDDAKRAGGEPENLEARGGPGPDPEGPR